VCEAATARKWECIAETSGYARIRCGLGYVLVPPEARLSTKDAAFIAASRTLTPALARGILNAIKAWDGLNGYAVMLAIANSFTGEGWE